jgi:hypothetical protein
MYHKPNYKTQTINILEKNLCVLGFGNKFLDTTLKAQSIKEKTGQVWWRIPINPSFWEPEARRS